MHSICRTCLREIAEADCVDLAKDANGVDVKFELSVCTPEIIVDKVINPVVCFKCVEALHSAYEFKTLCVQTEQRIDNYIKKNTGLSTDVDRLLQNLEISRLYSRDSTASRACPKPSTYDIIDDLNSLLDEALLSVPQHEEDENEDVDYSLDPVETQTIVENDEDKKVILVDDTDAVEPAEITQSEEVANPIITLNSTNIKQCFVKCAKLPDAVLTSVKVPKINRQKNANILKCKKCPFKTTQARCLQSHRKTHGAKSFICATCNFRTPYKANFARHLTSHSDEKPYPCHLCAYRGKNPDLVRKHMKAHHNGKAAGARPAPVKAPDAGAPTPVNATVAVKNFRTPYKANFARHLTSHSDEKPYPCHLCDYRGKNLYLVRRHMKVHYTGKGKAAGAPAPVNAPVAVKKKLVLSFCPMCPYKNVLKTNLIMHIKKKHDVENINELICPELVYTCKLCSYKCTSKTSLRRHIRRLHDVRTLYEQISPQHPASLKRLYACKICSYEGASKSLLKKHIRSHDLIKVFHKQTPLEPAALESAPLEKLYACKFCPYKAASNILLKRHNIRRHQDIKVLHEQISPEQTPLEPTPCESAPLEPAPLEVPLEPAPLEPAPLEAPLEPPPLEAPLEPASIQKVYACKLCMYRSVSINLYNRHCKEHRNGISFRVCPVCSFKTVYEHSMKRHLKAHHKINI